MFISIQHIYFNKVWNNVFSIHIIMREGHPTTHVSKCYEITLKHHFYQIYLTWIKIAFWTNTMGNTLGSGMGRPQASPSVGESNFPWTINFHLFLRCMKYMYYYILQLLISASKKVFYKHFQARLLWGTPFWKHLVGCCPSFV